MNRKFFKKNDAEEENIFWVTMTDMLLGLMMVFMTLFVLAMTGFTQYKMQAQATQSKVASDISHALDKQKIDVNIDKVTGQVKISDVELFDLNSYTLSKRGKIYLDKFIPIYIDIIFSNPQLCGRIANIVVQGHTDSQTYADVSSKEGQFVKNMDLSLKRANAVAEYIFLTGYNKKYTDKLTKTLVVEGRSYIEPVIIEGKEDFAKSRRVEIQLVVKDSNIQDFLKK